MKLDSRNDAELVGATGRCVVRQALERGDRDAALALCAECHGGMLGRLCMAMLGVQAEAEDVVQETLIDAHAGLMGWRGEGSVASIVPMKALLGTNRELT